MTQINRLIRLGGVGQRIPVYFVRSSEGVRGTELVDASNSEEIAWCSSVGGRHRDRCLWNARLVGLLFHTVLSSRPCCASALFVIFFQPTLLSLAYPAVFH